MHEYSTNVDRTKILITLAVLAIGAALLFNTLLQKLMIQIPWWVDAPSVMGFYAIFFALYDQVLWRVHLGPIPLSQIPNVNGVWAGVLTSSYQGETKIDIVFYITQTWSRIVIRTETATSTSSTSMAALNTKASTDPGLHYQYISIPEAFTKETMHIHRGTGNLSLSPDGKILKGDYYTGRDRITLGTLKLHFVSKEEISHEEALKRLTSQQADNES